MAVKNIKAKKNSDIDANIAMEELLELSTIEFDDEKKSNSSKSNVSKKTKDNEDEFDPTNLASIIKHAKKVGAEVNGVTWVDPDKKREDDIITKAKSQGKSAYDSDVLRELILQRQKQKNESKGLAGIINKAKK
ncbi:hypothetical protein [Spiroplasma monobiae]|uniref:Uncharacterized protein n=1 Tax=Spiroplasma monobiae MQ-1 TaxID=1336748 RepID=A0A2K9LW38_SPISQ|nr:hypothetical protein [Spiroplasma monobiae]AUM62595.1 hypothetical protein SMONO_v1c03460 [Spiroplasma monobiae MQ-1]